MKIPLSDPNPSTTQDLLELLARIRKDATAIQAKVSDALEMLGALNLPEREPARCGVCGLQLRGPLALAEHVYNSHDGPLPEHFIAAELAAGFTSPHTPAQRTPTTDHPDAGQLAASSTARATVSPATADDTQTARSTPAHRAAP